MSFNKSSLSFEIDSTWLPYVQSVDDNTLKFSAERWQAFFENLILVAALSVNFLE